MFTTRRERERERERERVREKTSEKRVWKGREKEHDAHDVSHLHYIDTTRPSQRTQCDSIKEKNIYA